MWRNLHEIQSQENRPCGTCLSQKITWEKRLQWVDTAPSCFSLSSVSPLQGLFITEVSCFRCLSATEVVGLGWAAWIAAFFRGSWWELGQAMCCPAHSCYGWSHKEGCKNVLCLGVGYIFHVIFSKVQSTYRVVLDNSQTRYFRAKLLGDLRDINRAKLEDEGRTISALGKIFDPNLSRGFDIVLVLQMAILPCIFK